MSGFSHKAVVYVLVGICAVAMVAWNINMKHTMDRMEAQLQSAGAGRYKRSVRSDDQRAAVTRRSESPRVMGGATYVRWGRTTCPDDSSELVYSGFAGSGEFQSMGGGANLICLSRHPEWANKTAAVEGHARIYGTEYESTKSWFSYRNAAKNTNNALHDHDVPCAVCRSSVRISQVMIPGRKTCHGRDWNREYWGYLMTSHYGHKKQLDYVCVDVAPEGDPKGAASLNGALLYIVQGVCGSLSCPPYVNGYEITCVVCTK